LPRSAPCAHHLCRTHHPPQPHTLSLHHAVPISAARTRRSDYRTGAAATAVGRSASRALGTDESQGSVKGMLEGGETLSARRPSLDRKSTRLNSSHLGISYAVFCLKKKNNTQVDL